MIKIIADSSCDLPKELIDKYNVEILPLHVHLGDKEYKDGVDITPDEIYDWADKNTDTPKTSVYSINAAINLFEQYPDDELICFAISSELSSSLNVMRLAMEDVEGEDRIYLVDSRNLSSGIALLICAAGDMISQGMAAKDIFEEINKLIPNVRSSFVVDTLTYLHKGGRCSSVAAVSGTMLRLHPRIVVKDGKMSSDKKYRGKMESVFMSYLEDIKQNLTSVDDRKVFITHSGCDQMVLDNVKKELEKLNVFKEVYITRAGSVVSSHCGPGTLGILYIEK